MTNNENAMDEIDALFDRALEIATNHLETAINQEAEASPYVPVAMLQVAVNFAVDVAGHEDIVHMLRDLADQIEADIETDQDN